MCYSEIVHYSLRCFDENNGQEKTTREIQGGMRRCNCSIKCVEHNSDICCKVFWLQLN